MELLLDGEAVNIITIGDTIAVLFDNDRSLVIENAFTITGVEGDVTPVNVKELGATGSEILRRLRERVAEATISAAGKLKITWETGSIWTVDPLADRDAWSVAEMGKEPFVECRPGGNLRPHQLLGPS